MSEVIYQDDAVGLQLTVCSNGRGKGTRVELVTLYGEVGTVGSPDAADGLAVALLRWAALERARREVTT